MYYYDVVAAMLVVCVYLVCLLDTAPRAMMVYGMQSVLGGADVIVAN